ncbi:MAG: c-type cytochrome [Hyphomicrobium sp.]|nr:c-type cytochrome [Hyphomicrobium sp.]
MKIQCGIAVVAVLVFSGGAPSAEADIAARGKSLVAANCSRCHAIEKNDKSTHREALPFREVVLRYPPDQLAEALAEGIMSGHPDMPEFTFEPAEIEAIVGYLATLKVR